MFLSCYSCCERLDEGASCKFLSIVVWFSLKNVFLEKYLFSFPGHIPRVAFRHLSLLLLAPPTKCVGKYSKFQSPD